MGYQGRAVVIDPDIFAVGDVLDGISDMVTMDGTTFFITGIWSYNAVELFLPEPVVFIDGFESGDTSGWSTTVN